MGFFPFLWGGLGAASAIGDPDDDFSFTSYTDADGAKMRVPRATVLCASDSRFNSALESPERCDPDAFEVRALRRGRGTTEGAAHRIVVQSPRAGETLASRELVLDFEEIAHGGRIRADDAAFHTDIDGAKIQPSTWKAFAVADSALNAALDQVPGTDQDAHHASFIPEAGDLTGHVHRAVLHATGRAGEAGASLALVLDFEEAGDPPPRGAA